MPGDLIQVGYASASGISRVSFIKTGSTTHSVNMDQRFLELPFTANGALLDVQLPSRAGDLPPGYYMLFVLDRSGCAVRRARSCASASRRAEPPVHDFTPIGGGGGGTPFTLACDANEVLVGVQRHDRHLRESGQPAVCTTINQFGQWIGTPVARGITGTAGTTTLLEDCARRTSRSAASAARFSQYVNQLDFECRALTSNGKLTGTGTFLGCRRPDTGTAAGSVALRHRTIPATRCTVARVAGWTTSACSAARRRRRSSTHPPVLAQSGRQSVDGRRGGRSGASAHRIRMANTLTFCAARTAAGSDLLGQRSHHRHADDARRLPRGAQRVRRHASRVTVNFSWSVTARPPFILDPLAPTTAQVTGDAGHVHGERAERRERQFTAGSSTTARRRRAYSSSPTITHTFTRPASTT